MFMCILTHTRSITTVNMQCTTFIYRMVVHVHSTFHVKYGTGGGAWQNIYILYVQYNSTYLCTYTGLSPQRQVQSAPAMARPSCLGAERLWYQSGGLRGKLGPAMPYNSGAHRYIYKYLHKINVHVHTDTYQVHNYSKYAMYYVYISYGSACA